MKPYECLQVRLTAEVDGGRKIMVERMMTAREYEVLGEGAHERIAEELWLGIRTPVSLALRDAVCKGKAR